MKLIPGIMFWVAIVIVVVIIGTGLHERATHVPTSPAVYHESKLFRITTDTEEWFSHGYDLQPGRVVFTDTTGVTFVIGEDVMIEDLRKK